MVPVRQHMKYGLTLQERLKNLIDFAEKHNLPLGCTSYGDLEINPSAHRYSFMPDHQKKETYDLKTQWPDAHETLLERLMKSCEDVCHSQWRHPPPYIDEEYPEVGYILGE